MLMASHPRIESATFKMAGMVDSSILDLSLITEWVKLLANHARLQQNKLFLSSKQLLMCIFSFSTLFCSLIILVAREPRSDEDTKCNSLFSAPRYGKHYHLAILHSCLNDIY